MAGEDMEQRMKQMARCWFSGFYQNSSEDILKLINEIQLDDLYNILKMIKSNLEKALVIYGPKVKAQNKKNIEKVFNNEK